ncbi:MAG: hypothetical protein ACM3O5_00550 [Betaproteobacteria bacterium]
MKRSLIAVAAAVSLTALSAVAQQTPPVQPVPGMGPGMGQGMGPMHGQAQCPMGGPMGGGMHRHGGLMQGQGFAQLDSDKDGKISKDEMAAQFDRLDTNKDGFLAREELRSAWAGRRHQHGPRMDANVDGLISRDEAQAAPRLAQNFDAIDANKDGSLTRDEIHAWRRAQSPAATAPVKP